MILSWYNDFRADPDLFYNYCLYYLVFLHYILYFIFPTVYGE